MDNSQMIPNEKSKFTVLAIIGKTIDYICNYAFIISYIALGLMSLPIIYDIIMRIFFHKSLSGGIEIQEYMLVVIVLLAIPYIQNKHGHIHIELLIQKFPKWIQDILQSFVYLSSAILFAIISWQGVHQAILRKNTLSQAFGFSISIFISLTAIGMFLYTLVLFKDFLNVTKKIIDEKKWPYLIPVFIVSFAIGLSPLAIDLFTLNISGLALGGLSMLLLFTLMLLGMPIGNAMALVGFLGMLIKTGNTTATFSMVGSTPYFATSSFTFAVIPLFILMGELALYSGISRDLFDTANKWLGRLPGGIAISGVTGCAGFAAISGDSMATALTMGTVTLPEMKKLKYNDALATGMLAAGGTLGILIPPSIGFIFYALITEESIGKLFVAGIIPGIVLASLFIATIYFIARFRPEMAPRGESYPLSVKIKSLKGIIGMLILIVLVLGGMLGGLFSPAEGGAVGAAGAFLIGIIKRRLSREDLIKALKESAFLTTQLFLILIGVAILGYFLAATRLPVLLAETVAGLPFDRYVIFLLICIVYIILGCLMNVVPMILLTLPALVPTIQALGFDLIWFGVVMVILMELGQITPPVGINVYAISTIAKDVPMETIFKGIIPFFICMLFLIILLVLFPQLALFLPNLLF